MAIATIKTETDDDRSQAQCGEADIFPQLCDRGVQHDAMGARRQPQAFQGDSGDEQHRAQQQRRDRGVAKNRQTAEGRQPRQRRTEQQQS